MYYLNKPNLLKKAISFDLIMVTFNCNWMTRVLSNNDLVNLERQSDFIQSRSDQICYFT